LQSHHKGWKISRVPNIDYLAKTNEKWLLHWKSS
jgi:hypothetical protein